MDIRDHQVSIDYLIKKTKQTSDVTWLTEHLRDHNRAIPPVLRDFIATLLEQKYKSTKLTEYQPSRASLRLDICTFKRILEGKTEIPWSDILEGLKNIGIQDEKFDTKGKITETAKAMAMKIHNLTESQLDEAINPREHRKKYRS